MPDYAFSKVTAVDRLEKEIRDSTITIALDSVSMLGTATTCTFKSTLSTAEEAVLSAIIAAHSPTPLPSNVSQNVQIVGPSGRIQDPVQEGIFGSSGVTFISHDFGDRTTWYQRSVRVIDEIAVDSGDGLTFNSANPWWINIYSKKITFLRNKVSLRDGSTGKHSDFAVIVKVNNSVISSNAYSVDFESGKIVFNSAQTGNEVKITYNHNNNIANRSEWILAPASAKEFIVRRVEIQVSTTCKFEKPLRFEIWAGRTIAQLTAENFPDAYFDAGYGQMRADYQDVRGLLNHANCGYNFLPMPQAGIADPVAVLPFDYVKSILMSGKNMVFVRIINMDDVPLTDAELCTVSFYAEVI